MITIKGHKISGGKGEGEVIMWQDRFAFHGDVNPATGKFVLAGHPLLGQSIANKVFIFSAGRGSSQNARVTMEAKNAGNAPAAMICLVADPVTATGAIMAGIPFVDKLDKNPFDLIEPGDYVIVDADKGIVQVKKKS